MKTYRFTAAESNLSDFIYAYSPVRNEAPPIETALPLNIN